MTVGDGKSATGHEKTSTGSGKSESPTDALTAALAGAERAFHARHEGDERVMVAFSLGWQMAEVYRPDRRRSSVPAAQDDLPGISRLSAPELLEMGLLQVQAGITKLSDPICDAGLELPDAERFAQEIVPIEDPQLRDEAIRAFHVVLLSTLTAADFRYGKAYGLGRALADTTRLPPDWRAELATHRIGTLATWIRDLSSSLPPHAAHPVAQSLEAWSRWAQTQAGDGGDTRRKLSAQGRLWRSLLSGEKRPVGVLETSDYLQAGEGMVKRTGALILKFLRHYWWVVLIAIVLLGGGVWLIVGPGSGVAAGFGGASIFASIGLSWKGIGTSLGTAGARVEEPLWQAELDTVIYARITPEEIVKSQSKRKPGPDEPSLVADTQGEHQHPKAQAATAAAASPRQEP
jgi:hypothetical protein